MEYPEELEPPDVITSDTDNATKIQPKDAPPDKKQKFQRFRAYNTGTWNGPKRENKEAVHRQDDLHRYDSIASSLGLTDYQKRRGRKIFDKIDITTKRIGVDVFIFSVCVIVANSDVENGTRYYPQPNAPDDKVFSNIANSLGIDRGQQISAIEKVRQQINF